MRILIADIQLLGSSFKFLEHMLQVDKQKIIYVVPLLVIAYIKFIAIESLTKRSSKTLKA
jgi:hypothetical protein